MTDDAIGLSCYVWQQRLLSIANEIEAMAEEENFHRLYEVKDFINDAMAKIDEVSP
jgi:hypothetical protein